MDSLQTEYVKLGVKHYLKVIYKIIDKKNPQNFKKECENTEGNKSDEWVCLQPVLPHSNEPKVKNAAFQEIWLAGPVNMASPLKIPL